MKDRAIADCPSCSIDHLLTKTSNEIQSALNFYFTPKLPHVALQPKTIHHSFDIYAYLHQSRYTLNVIYADNSHLLDIYTLFHFIHLNHPTLAFPPLTSFSPLHSVSPSHPQNPTPSSSQNPLLFSIYNKAQPHLSTPQINIHPRYSFPISLLINLYLLPLL